MKRKPTKSQCEAAHGKTVPDLIKPRLRILFCGINPSLYSAAAKAHFARPGNRFWPAMLQSGLIPRKLDPSEGEALLELGYGVTNLVRRATASAGELSQDELLEGGRALERKVKRLRPVAVAFLGIGAYRQAFGEKNAVIGKQERRIAGSLIWVLPNPSGLNASYQLPDLARAFRNLRDSVMAEFPT